MEKKLMIDWQSLESEIFFNPRLPAVERQQLLTILNHTSHLKGHLWFMTSGSTGSPKLVALSKEAILTSAQAVNRHLQSDASDIWLNPLPEFHVGGLGISARSYLSGAKWVDFKSIAPKWNAVLFHEALVTFKATLSSLVPAQVYDLVSCGVNPPKSLRGIIVGGDLLRESLYRHALQLGWKLLPSYGLTECASQVATASLKKSDFPFLPPLGHVDLGIDERGFIKIKSPALLTCYASFFEGGWQLADPKVDDWFTTRDKGMMENGLLKVMGRDEHFVKIGGEITDLRRLEFILDRMKQHLKLEQDAALIVMPDERLGHVIHLAVERESSQQLVEGFQEQVLPYERIRKVYVVENIPRSPLKKLLRQEMLKVISCGIG
jgi:O-succinylbenzoic acid--CoA ligase